MKKVIIAVAGTFMCAQVSAQTDSPGFWNDPVHHPMAPLYGVIALTFVVLILAIVVSLLMLRAFNLLVEQAAREKAVAKGIAYVPRPTFWSRFSRRINASVPIEQEEDIDMGHSYDGIRELDNHLPPWWKWLFYGTIAWSAVYIFVFHISASLPLMHDEYLQEVAVAEEAKQKFLASQPQAAIDVDNLVFAPDAAIIGEGKKVFLDNNCGSCHRNDGGGNTIGPNLTDAYWLHGAEVKAVYNTVAKGVVEKGMPAWGKSLSPTEVRDVTFFVISLRGSNPPNAKAPQGQLVEPAPAAAPADSLKTQASL